MTRRGLIRLFGVTTVSLLMVVAGAFAWTAVASAHVVTGIEADCTHVTVGFANFPNSGVIVHISVTVTGQPPITTDVLVTKHSGPAVLDISSVTSDLFGATANVDVDVTWTFEGPQHVEQTLQVTCGETTSSVSPSSSSPSTESTTSTTTGAGAVSSSTDTSETTSSTVGSASSSTTDTEAPSSSTSLGPVGGGGAASTTSSTGPAATSGVIKVAGESVSSPGATVAAAATGNSGGSLPFTGLATVPLLVFGVAALTAGAAAISAARRRRMTNP